MATLLAGAQPGTGSFPGYVRSGGYYATVFGASWGSLGPEPVSGFLVDALFSGDAGSGNKAYLFLQGDATSLNPLTITVDGTAWISGVTGSYTPITNLTTFEGSNYSFVSGTSYAVLQSGGPPPFAGPTWIGATSPVASTSAMTLDFSSSGRAAGDKLYIAIETANQAIAAPSGFTEVPTVSPQSRGTAGAAGGVRLTLFEKVSTGSETTLTIADSGDHQYAVGLVIRPASGQSIVIDASAGKNAAASTSQSGNGLTTGANDCFLLDIWATDRDSAGPSYSGQANASLANLTERVDGGTTLGQGGGLVVFTGEKQAAGSVSATTATSASSSAYCAITLALRNSGAAVPYYRGPIGWSTFYKGTRSDAQIWKGVGPLHA